MLRPWQHEPPSDLDQQVFEALVPTDHYLRRVKAALDFETLRPLLAECYPSGTGRPAVEPVLLLKLEFLEYHYNLSDREVIAQARVNVAFRFFLDLSLYSGLPHHTLLTYFRERLGADPHRRVFDGVVAQARQHGLVKDRLRLKDATHIIANIAIPSTIRLVAQTREQVLAAAEPLWPEWVAEQRDHAANLRLLTESLADAERLLQRVTHLRQIVVELEQRLHDAPPADGVEAAAPRHVREALRLARHVLADREPRRKDDKSDRVVSIHDPEARKAKHGAWYTGYLLDVAEDADSEIITAVNVLPANGDEGADAAKLITQEEQAHGNRVQAMSMDGAGFRGDVLRELSDPQGLNLEVITPPPPEPERTVFGPEAFALTAPVGELTCPNGQKTGKRTYCPPQHGWKYRFSPEQCAACPLRSQCLQNPKQPFRTVIKNDYEAEYRNARAKAQTPAYARVRKEHPKIERKLGEIVRWHRARRARYWGGAKVLVQALLTTLAVNVKRMVHMLAVLPERAVRRAKVSIFSGCNSHPATVAPAGSNRSGGGGNEIAEAFDGKDRNAVPRAGRP
jgi:transposase